MKLLNFKTLISSLAIITMVSGCAQKTGNTTYDENQNAIIGTTIGAIAGIVLGNNIGGGNKGRNKVIGAVAGAAIVLAGLAKINPIELTKRNFIPMVAATITSMFIMLG